MKCEICGKNVKAKKHFIDAGLLILMAGAFGATSKIVEMFIIK